MKFLLSIIAFSIFLNGYSQLYSEEGLYDLDIAKKNSFKYISNEYEIKSLNYSEAIEGNVYIDISPKEIEMYEDESFQFILNVTSIVTKKTGGGIFYTLYIGNDSEGVPATFAVKWNIFSEQYYFEYEAGKTPQDSYKYTFYEASISTEK